MMLNKQTTGLIVVDIQGKLARLMHDSDTMIANCAALIQGVQLLDLPILWLEQIPEKIGETVAEIGGLLHQQRPIKKVTFGAGGNVQFMEALQAISHVKTWLICGIETHICVYQSALQLQQSGYNVQLVTDCTASRTPENKALAISRLSAENVAMTGLEMCLYELLEDCNHAAFKDILNLVK